MFTWRVKGNTNRMRHTAGYWSATMLHLGWWNSEQAAVSLLFMRDTEAGIQSLLRRYDYQGPYNHAFTFAISLHLWKYTYNGASWKPLFYRHLQKFSSHFCYSSHCFSSYFLSIIDKVRHADMSLNWVKVGSSNGSVSNKCWSITWAIW